LFIELSISNPYADDIEEHYPKSIKADTFVILSFDKSPKFFDKFFLILLWSLVFREET
jgi:hypothetical protein